jgi:hypothetical protein
MLYLFVVGLPMVMVAIFISMADSLLYPYYAGSPRVWAPLTPRADQHLGGLIMWIPGGMVFLTALSVVFFRWQGAGGDDTAVRGEAAGEPSGSIVVRGTATGEPSGSRAVRGEAAGEPSGSRAVRGEAAGEPSGYKSQGAT